jgi:probable F420-dependent oxidoreductase
VGEPNETTTPKARPIRFVTGVGRTADPAVLRATAQKAEQLGYSAFGMADHLMTPFAPLIGLQAAADATRTIRLTQVVLAEGFRHPAVLAKELATLDVLSGGRLEVGIGAGWMGEEFEQAGISFEKASVRIERLEEAVTVLKGLFAEGPFSFGGRHFRITELDGTPKPVQRPHPPIMIGGGGPKLLAAAARQADIVQVLPGAIRGMSAGPSGFTAAAYREKVELIRDAAGARFGAIELGALLLNVTITDDVERAVDDFMGTLKPTGTDRPSEKEILASPVVAIGSMQHVCDKLVEARDAFGFSYFAGPVGLRAEVLAPVVQQLAGV